MTQIRYHRSADWDINRDDATETTAAIYEASGLDAYAAFLRGSERRQCALAAYAHAADREKNGFFTLANIHRARARKIALA